MALPLCLSLCVETMITFYKQLFFLNILLRNIVSMNWIKELGILCVKWGSPLEMMTFTLPLKWFSCI